MSTLKLKRRLSSCRATLIKLELPLVRTATSSSRTPSYTMWAG